MIGVLVHRLEQPSVREFFELCKTAWEFFEPGRQYDIVLTTGEISPVGNPLLVLRYCGRKNNETVWSETEKRSKPRETYLSYGERRVPIYGEIASYPKSTISLVTESITGHSIVQASRYKGATLLEIGYDLFHETRQLLTTGQPAANASMPAVDIHIRLFCDLITRAGLPFLEIPPVPAGYKFAACLTHDVDHPLLKNHRRDHTVFGFLHRATLGSLINVFKGRMPATRLWQNLAAAVQLPLLQLGWARDLWRDFDRYVRIEAGRPSTFFVIPEKGSPGRTRDGVGPARRSCNYELEEIVPTLAKITSAGSSVSLHGLNAWLEAEDGRREKARLSQAMGAIPIENGVRMHWLCFDENSPAALDAAGFSYDSSVGYNETVGFRAGTVQVYRPLSAQNLLELPLHVMDTALFFPDFLNLREAEAHALVGRILANFTAFGGVFTLNWHDRSIAPERLWENFYVAILDELQARGAWFATAAQAVAWFQMRRSSVIELMAARTGKIGVRVRATTLDSTLPSLKIRLHQPHALAGDEILSSRPERGFTDLPFKETIDTTLTL